MQDKWNKGGVVKWGVGHAHSIPASQVKELLDRADRTDKGEELQSVAVVKLFNPADSWTWYLSELRVGEGEEGEAEYLAYGYVEGFEKEYGYIWLNELFELKLPMGLQIERDIHWTPRLMKDVVGGRINEAAIKAN